MVRWAERKINFDKKGQNGSKLERKVANKWKIEEWNRKEEKKTRNGMRARVDRNMTTTTARKTKRGKKMEG